MTITELMRVLQFGDSLLPVGAFTFSNALESAVQQGQVTDGTTLHEFVLTATRQAATLDGIALLQSHRGALEQDLARVACADHALFGRKLNEEMRVMTVRMGRKLGELAVHAVPDTPLLSAWLDRIASGTTPGTYPVGLAVLFAALGLPEDAAFATHQYGVATMLLGAALRLMKVSYLDAQQILFAVNMTTETTYRSSSCLTLEDMAAFAPVTDILAAAHVKASVRLFMN